MAQAMAVAEALYRKETNTPDWMEIDLVADLDPENGDVIGRVGHRGAFDNDPTMYRGLKG